MPRNLPQFTKCAAPGLSHAIDGLSIAGMAVVALILGLIGGGVYATVMVLLGEVAKLGCVLGTAAYLFFIIGILEFKDWYYNYRLMCILHNQCCCGTVVGEPHESSDGDRKFEILIAPFDVPETEQLLIQTLVEMGMAGTLSGVPDEMDLQDRQTRFGYMRGLSETDQIKVHLELVDNHMFNQPGRRFLRYFYRRDNAIMGAAAFSHSPDDDIAASSPNPMFRINPQEGGDPEEKVLVPYMHCELEGNRLARWLDNVLVGLIAGALAFITFCVLCEVITMGALDFLCGWLGGLISFLLALLFWFLSHLINDPDDGVAGSPDVDVEDPDFDTPPSSVTHGDVAYVFGDWVMDEEHGKYFEIHTIKAWYLLCRGETDPDDWQLTEETPSERCAFDVTQLTEDDFARICKIVQAVENTDPKDLFTTTISHGLSMGPH
jgi:hypothetical protein